MLKGIVKPTTNLFRKYSSTAKNIKVTLDDKTGIALLTLQRPPVNSLNLELLTEFSDALTDLDKNKSRGIILTSSSDSVFSAGLDILELYKPKEDRARKFWTTLQEVWIKLYSHNTPTVACIAGHAPAGGCLLALSCEYRVMVKNKTIGLNETKLGIVAPFWFAKSMENVIGIRNTEIALTSGRMFSTEEAAKVHLVDEVAENSDEAYSKCIQFLNLFQNISPLARTLTKNVVRGQTVESLKKRREADTQEFLNTIMSEKVQQGLGLYLESLKKKK